MTTMTRSACCSRLAVWLRDHADYDNLSTHVPNLVESSRRTHPTGGIRIFQEGAQKIVGFDFRASLVMDMTEFTDEVCGSPHDLSSEEERRVRPTPARPVAGCDSANAHSILAGRIGHVWLL